VTGDYDGDGIADPAYYRPGNNYFFWLKSTTNYIFAGEKLFGYTGDEPIAGDFDGDGKTDPAIFRRANGLFAYASSANGEHYSKELAWPNGDDVPLVGDYDGDGRDDFAYYRPGNGYFVYATSASNYLAGGLRQVVDPPLIGVIPLAGDYDGDGKTEFAYYRPSDGTFYWETVQDPASGGTSGSHLLGFAGTDDMPLVGDYDGDGKSDPALFRPGNGYFIYASSANGYEHRSRPFAEAGEVPLGKPHSVP
jgi:hypothetical protein